METPVIEAVSVEVAEQVLDTAAELASAKGVAEHRAAQLEIRVAQLQGLLGELLEEFQDRQDITDSGGPDWCMRSAMRIESALAERE